MLKVAYKYIMVRHSEVTGWGETWRHRHLKCGFLVCGEHLWAGLAVSPFIGGWRGEDVVHVCRHMKLVKHIACLQGWLGRLRLVSRVAAVGWDGGGRVAADWCEVTSRVIGLELVGV